MSVSPVEVRSRRKPWKPSKLASCLGLSARTIKRRIEDGALPAKPVGNGRYVIEAHVCEQVIEFGLPSAANAIRT